MIDSLIGGKQMGDAQERTGPSGKTFVTCKMRVPTANGDTVIANLIAFDASVKAALLAHSDGDTLAIAGAVTPKAWIDKSGNAKASLDVTAQGVLSAYHVTRKRQAVKPKPQAQHNPWGNEDLDGI